MAATSFGVLWTRLDLLHQAGRDRNRHLYAVRVVAELTAGGLPVPDSLERLSYLDLSRPLSFDTQWVRP